MLDDDDDDFQVSQDTLSRIGTSHKSNHTGSCPCCQKYEGNLEYTINKKGSSLAICAYSAIAQQLIAERVGDGFDSKCFSVCQVCYRSYLKAIKAADTHFNGEVEWLSVGYKIQRSLSTILQSPLYCGEGKTLV